MAVDKMQMFSIVAPLGNLHGIMEDLVLSGSVHTKNNTESGAGDSLTMSYIESQIDNSFELGGLHNINYFKSNFKEVYDKLEQISNSIHMTPEIHKNIERNYDYKAG